MNQLVPIAAHDPSPVELYRVSTDAAEVCKGIVTASATNIQGRRFVTVEGWQAIAIAHGCAAGARDVERVDGGVRAIGEVRRMSDGQLIAQAEGFVGEDEETWFGGKNRYGKELPKRNDYAIRAMAQTRAISRACRSAFAHVVVMMNAGLSTTPAEEVPDGGFDDARSAPQPAPQPAGPRLITDDQFSIVHALLKATGVPLAKVLKSAEVTDLKQMSEADATALIDSLNGIIAKRAATKPPADQAPIIDDEIPY